MSWHHKAKRVYDFVRGLSPYPGAWTNMVSAEGKSSVLKVFRTTKTAKACHGEQPGTLYVEGGRLLVAAADDWLQLDVIQLSGKKRMEAGVFLNGFRDIDKYHLE